jgi:hypothetical protein
MPEKKTIEAAEKDRREGKSASTQAGEFVREEMHHIRDGEHGARSAKQAIAIGLSKARRAGVALPPQDGDGEAKGAKGAKKEKAPSKRGSEPIHAKPVSKTRSKAAHEALEDEPQAAASHRALSRHARAAASERTPEERSESAKKAARTKGAKGRSEAAKKAAKTRAAHAHA